MTESRHPTRRSLRLQGYDYSQPDAYFVTIVVQDRINLFGDIAGGEMQLNDPGRMIEKWWIELSNKFPAIELDEHIIMPNHSHAVIWLVWADLRVGPGRQAVSSVEGLIDNNKAVSLPSIMQWFKTMTTNDYIRGVKQHNWKPFPGKLWQRSYYDHVVRDDVDLDNIRRYIQGNPVLWEQDSENPMNGGSHK